MRTRLNPGSDNTPVVNDKLPFLTWQEIAAPDQRRGIANAHCSVNDRKFTWNCSIPPSLSLSLSTNDRRTNDYLSLQGPIRSFPTEWNGIWLQRFDPRGNPPCVRLCRRRRYYPPPRHEGAEYDRAEKRVSRVARVTPLIRILHESSDYCMCLDAVSACVSRALPSHSSPLRFELSRVLLLRVHTCREEGRTTTDRARGDNARSESRLHSSLVKSRKFMEGNYCTRCFSSSDFSRWSK